jgi:NADH-quinone oxidoreductase subunit L
VDRCSPTTTRPRRGCFLLLVGAFAKSAQVPLHTWLPDAMEGPTPVSALIHAATMVTAGVYLIARMHPLFEQAPAAGDVGAIVGCLTLLIAASIGLVGDRPQARHRLLDDVADRLHGHGRLLAAYAAGMFHMMTHAFFKALLFMAPAR